MADPNWVWDELVLACALVAHNRWKELRQTDPEVIELSRLLREMPLHDKHLRSDKFRSPNSVSRKTGDIMTHHPGYKLRPTRGGRLDVKVIQAFLARPAEMLLAADLIREGIRSGTFAQLSPAIDEEVGGEPTANEGRLLVRQHSVRERDRKLRIAKIDLVFFDSGRVACEVCDFDFGERYGQHGSGYIEVHHVVPLHMAGERKTTLSDLAVLCANCHRMAHRKLDPTGQWPTPTDLRRIIAK